MPHINGVVASGFEPVAAAFAANFEAGEELGAAFALVVDDEPLVNIWAGSADRSGERPWSAQTLTPVYSTTKPIAALVAAMLVDQGRLAYDAPVAEIWPEFGAHGKRTLTLAQMLSHQGGLPGFPDPIDPALWFDPPALAGALAAATPMWPPGTDHGYHPLTFGYLIGEVVARASGGRSLGTILREDVCAPLGVDFWIGTPASEHGRCAEIARPKAAPDLGEITADKRAAFLTPWAAPNRGGAAWREAEIPSANGHGTALAVARLYGAYACTGRIGDTRLFSPATHAALTAERATGPDRVLPFSLSVAAGIMRNSNLFWGPNPNGFGHAGWGGSCGFADPERGVSGAYVMNRQSNKLMNDPRARRLIDAAFACWKARA